LNLKSATRALYRVELKLYEGKIFGQKLYSDGRILLLLRFLFEIWNQIMVMRAECAKRLSLPELETVQNYQTGPVRPVTGRFKKCFRPVKTGKSWPVCPGHLPLVEESGSKKTLLFVFFARFLLVSIIFIT
jgi:hypothetical protein